MHGNQKYTKEIAINQANLIHNSFYSYELLEFKTVRDKVKIICPNHGVFEQVLHKHLNPNSKRGCRKCAEEKASLNLRMSKDEFVERCNKIYNNKYDYSLVEFKNQHSKVEIKCPLHGVFKQSVQSHLRGKKCRKCAKEEMIFNKSFYDFSKESWLKITKKGFLYLVKCYNDNEIFYKVGITGKSIEQRFKYEKLYKIEIIDFLERTENLEEIWDKEVLFHSKNKEYKYIPQLEFNGKSECYTYSDEILKNFISLKEE